MARPDWLRTFVAIYRAGSVTEGARRRALSQPAASQQLAGLERAVGSPLFARTPEGVTPTERGRSLFAQVASPLDQLEVVLSGLDAGTLGEARAPVRLGSSAELFAAEVLPKVAAAGVRVVARFGDDEDLVDRLVRGDLDAAVTGRPPSRRTVDAVPAGEKRFVLVAAPSIAHDAPSATLDTLGDWLVGRPWAAYSLELPLTRRFWQAHLGRAFAATLRLVAPDLRVVVEAVAMGVGCSILPSFVCTDRLTDGRIVELHPISELMAPEPWFCCTRQGEATRPPVARLLAALVPGGNA